MNFLFLLVVFTCAYCILRNLYLSIKKTNAETKKQLERLDQVAQFRWIIFMTNQEKYSRLPEMEEMVYDNKPLTLESYFPEINN